MFVCNPNNPTGTSVGRRRSTRFVASLPAELVLVVDEAYREFARRPDFPTRSPGSRAGPGTIVMRTFSKIYGLAGLRVGYGVCDRGAGRLPEPRAPPVQREPRSPQAAAVAALDDDAHARAHRGA